MKYIKLRLENWRSFYGVHTVNFSSTPSRPLTLLIGPNGAGKTALLNSFTWCLYGTFTPGFKRPESLVNDQAIRENVDAVAKVSLEFEHEGALYVVDREVNSTTQKSGTAHFRIRKDGTIAQKDDLQRIFPESLRDIFFIDSETFTSVSIFNEGRRASIGSLDIKIAIQSMLSGDVYDNACKDIDQAITNDSLRVSKATSDSALTRIEAQFRDIEQTRVEKERRLAQLPGQIADAKMRQSEATERARGFDPQQVEKWRGELDRLTRDAELAEQMYLKCCDASLSLAKHLHYYFACPVVRNAVTLLDVAEARGLIPPRVDRSLLEKALTDHKCTLCGSSLEEIAIGRVKLLLETVTDGDVAVAAIEARTKLQEYCRQKQAKEAEHYESLHSLATALHVTLPLAPLSLADNLATLKTCKDVAERKRRQARQSLDDFRAGDGPNIYREGNNPVDQLARAQIAVYTLEREREELEAEVENLKSKESVAFQDLQAKSRTFAKSRQRAAALSFLKDARSFFDEARRGLARYGRHDFEIEVALVYERLIRKPFSLKVAEDFSIRAVRKGDGQQSDVVLSQAESVLVLLAFLGALARLAPQYKKIADLRLQFAKVGSVRTEKDVAYPVVLDAPTSPFDGEYERDVISALPELLPQIVVPVSAKSISEWEIIADKVGAFCILELTSAKSSNRTIRWLGQDYIYSSFDADATIARTRVVQVSST